MLLIGIKKIMPILHCLKIGMIYNDIAGCLWNMRLQVRRLLLDMRI